MSISIEELNEKYKLLQQKCKKFQEDISSNKREIQEYKLEIEKIKLENSSKNREEGHMTNRRFIVNERISQSNQIENSYSDDFITISNHQTRDKLKKVQNTGGSSNRYFIYCDFCHHICEDVYEIHLQTHICKDCLEKKNDPHRKILFIYILQLEEGKWYVGKTVKPFFRVADHFQEGACKWTQLYKPIRIEKMIAQCDPYDENKYTLMYMDKYHHQNVRGGAFVQEVLPKEMLQIIEIMQVATTDRCHRCKKIGHFIRNCTQTSTFIIPQQPQERQRSRSPGTTFQRVITQTKNEIPKKKWQCYACGQSDYHDYRTCQRKKTFHPRSKGNYPFYDGQYYW